MALPFEVGEGEVKLKNKEAAKNKNLLQERNKT